MNIEKKSGFFLLNKPIGPTSHDMVDELRRITGIRKIGHAGTLDPFASGLLIMAIGREATKRISKYVKLDKEYVATLHLGAVSTTYDPEGEITKKLSFGYPKLSFSVDEINKVLEKFKGEQKQIPPMFSAKKVKGKKLYELARKGIEIEREAVDINIYELELLSFKWPELVLRVKCSSGTYIRSLGYDFGEVLGCGAYLSALKRTAIGNFFLEDSYNLSEINSGDWEGFLTS
jgi:tRNA pseudouridine55 synthase